ncbi:MAG: hypothetical protein H0U74_01730 [Bradymonadaceae bacterium]|nr:hypothetical protein [Lujinxingiaceae bacterium]
MVAKIKLSESMRFLPTSEEPWNEQAGGEARLWVEIDDKQEGVPGEYLRAQVHLGLAEAGVHRIDYVAIALDGVIGDVSGDLGDPGEQRTHYVHAVEIAHDKRMAGQTRLTLPIFVCIPENAVSSAQGAHWRLEARAVVAGELVATGQASLIVGEATRDA